MYPLNPPFQLGQTLDGTDDNSDNINNQWLGMKFDFYTPTSNDQRGNKQTLAYGMAIRAIILRNNSGLTLLPKRLAIVSSTAGYGPVQQVIGYSNVLHQKPVILIDPYLPSTGVADKALFWGIISGPVLGLTPHAGADFGSDIAVNDLLVAATGTTTGATTCGRLAKPQLANATAAADALAGAAGMFCRALSAKTTGNTNADILVQMFNPWFGK